MELLERHFDIAFDAPDGIKKLRELIFTLAMQGKLVPHDPNDPPASELLKKVEAEKKRLVKEGKIKEPKPLPPVSPEEKPYELPKGWEWVRLDEIGTWKSGTTPSRTNHYYYGGPIPWVKSGEVKQGRVKGTEETITAAALSECSLHINPVGSVLIAMYGANIGEVGILEIEATTNQAVCACQAYSGIDKNFLLAMLRSLKRDFISQGAGAAQPNISREKIITTIAPLPPAAEQNRIVAKIDELMARCDALQKLRAERNAKRLAVHTASVRQLLNVAATDGHTQAREFLGQHFGELCIVKENVSELRKAILQLAVMGKLVPQDTNEKHSAKLLRHIKLLEENKESFPIPASWIWVRVSQVAETRLGKMLDKAKNVGIPRRYLRNTNVRWFDFDLSDVFEMRFRDEELEEFSLREGDVLICEGGEPGRAAVWDEREHDIYFQKAIHRVRFPEGVKPHFFLNALRESVDSGRLSAYFTGVGIKHFTGKGLASFTFPLPPLAEQHRIVAKIDQLMSMCDSVEQQIDDARELQTALLNAMMARYGVQ